MLMMLLHGQRSEVRLFHQNRQMGSHVYSGCIDWWILGSIDDPVIVAAMSYTVLPQQGGTSEAQWKKEASEVLNTWSIFNLQNTIYRKRARLVPSCNPARGLMAAKSGTNELPLPISDKGSVGKCDLLVERQLLTHTVSLQVIQISTCSPSTSCWKENTQRSVAFSECRYLIQNHQFMTFPNSGTSLFHQKPYFIKHRAVVFQPLYATKSISWRNAFCWLPPNLLISLKVTLTEQFIKENAN